MCWGYLIPEAQQPHFTAFEQVVLLSCFVGLSDKPTKLEGIVTGDSMNLTIDGAFSMLLRKNVQTIPPCSFMLFHTQQQHCCPFFWWQCLQPFHISKSKSRNDNMAYIAFWQHTL
jgi:hypothetical protein